MVSLKRTIRFAINTHQPVALTPNGYAGSPSIKGFGRHYELDVVCEGEIHRTTGYLLDIKSVDRAVRGIVIPLIHAACRDHPESDPEDLMPRLVDETDRALGGRLRSLTFRLTPTYGVTMENADRSTVLLKQRFDFAAAHRLHVPSMTPEQNRAVFGKCNNPAGHGHNYQIEPVVAVKLGSGKAEDANGRFSLQTLEDVTEQAIIRRFDHKHLNEDTAQFSTGSGAVPSVEEIARVFYDLLAPEVAKAGGALRSMTVWETDRTCATYPG